MRKGEDRAHRYAEGGSDESTSRDSAEKTVRDITPSPEGPAVHFVGLTDGATLPTKATIRFGLRDMGVAPAGFERANSGHHHLLIDTELPLLDQRIPNDFNHLHYGAGQTEAEITLKPGTHTLQLLFGDKITFCTLPRSCQHRFES